MFKETYTTEAIKTAILSGIKITPEEKAIEENKAVVSNEAYLNAEMILELINNIERLRLSLI